MREEHNYKPHQVKSLVQLHKAAAESGPKPLTCGYCGRKADYTGDHFFEDDLIFYKIKCETCGKASLEKYELVLKEIICNN